MTAIGRIYVEAAGLYAPGLDSWEQGRAVLQGSEPWRDEPLGRYRPALLPANERRRASALVRLAFGACEQAVAGRLPEAAGLAGVFASSGGDYAINDQICRTLASPERMVSPTQFHNSVHNAPAGYWGIATGSREPSLSLCAYDFTVGAALLESATLVVLERRALLLAVYDDVVAWPMSDKRGVTRPFSAALWLTPEPTSQSLCGLAVALPAGPQPATTAAPGLERLRLSNPAARILPLLERMAGRPGPVALALPGGRALLVEVVPC